MMKIVYFFVFVCLFSCTFSIAQSSFLGVWKGVIYENTMTDTSSKVVYVKISKYKNICDVSFRVERLQSTDFYVSRITGAYTNDSLYFKDVVFDQKSMILSTKEKYRFKVTVNDSSGYMIADLLNEKDQKIAKSMVLFKVSDEFVSIAKKEVNQAWFYVFLKEYSIGMVAPQKREEERNYFQFQSVYFQPALAELSPDYHSYLKKVINVINGHTDLRLKVIGHTDWDGSDQYNEDLSKKRAEAIIQFLEQNGLSRDRIEYEYQGEKKPVDTNKTSEGKKRNRRVDFQFI